MGNEGLGNETTAEEIVRTYYTDIDANNVDAALAPFADDATYWRAGYDPLVGIDAIREFYSGTRVIAEGRHELESVVAGGTSVAVRGTFRGISHDGKPLETRFADFWDFAGSQVIKRNTYFGVGAV